MLKQSRFIEISLDKELENGYEYMLKVNLPDKGVIYQKIKIEDIICRDINETLSGKYECDIVFKTAYAPEMLLNE